MNINLAAFLKRSRSNGPGLRAVVWVQGCSRSCPDCFNPEMQPFEPGKIVKVDDLAERILEINDISGVTFTGGEPFEQSEALSELAQILRKKKMNIITFTGYEYEELKKSNRPDFKALLSVTDLLVAGPYIAGLKTNRPLCGSSNQLLHFLSGRFENHPGLSEYKSKTTEFTVTCEGDVIITGFPDFTDADCEPFAFLQNC